MPYNIMSNVCVLWLICMLQSKFKKFDVTLQETLIGTYLILRRDRVELQAQLRLLKKLDVAQDENQGLLAGEERWLRRSTLS